MERKFSKGDRVRHHEYGEGTVTDVLNSGSIQVDFGKDGHIDTWYFADHYNDVKWKPSSLTPITSTISTIEMIKALMENPKLKAHAGDELALEIKGGYFVWPDGSRFMRDGINDFQLTEYKWTLIYPTEPKPVGFIDAVNSGKRIKPDDKPWVYATAQGWLEVLSEGSMVSSLKLINGKWLIKED